MITCSVCGYDQNPDRSEYCDACGAELAAAPAIAEPVSGASATVRELPTFIPPQQPVITDLSTSNTQATIIQTASATTARLIAKQSSPPLSEAMLDNNAIVGIFGSDSGPVDVDLELFSGSDTVSRNHAEIYNEGGIWKVKDLGSTNGTFIKPVGQSRFGARITTPTVLNPGDEIAFAKVRFIFQSS